MWEDPILKEVYRVRAEISKKAPNLRLLNLGCKSVAQRLRESGHPTITRPFVHSRRAAKHKKAV